jgi:hypothetical protein
MGTAVTLSHRPEVPRTRVARWVEVRLERALVATTPTMARAVSKRSRDEGHEPLNLVDLVLGERAVFRSSEKNGDTPAGGADHERGA